MHMNKGNLLIWGVMALFFGLQFHYFDSFVLTEKASSFYYNRFEKKSKVEKPSNPFLRDTPQVSQRKTIKPPPWLGRCLMSVGGVLVFQSLVVRRIE
ncbi:MAG: hypothetical protein P8M80_12700 [Pirellulaceae bacterium]|jgi:hypothetical protein|nr:hypothetical protein [Pirellulaceae bacterium]MDG2470133.1 hypothetical protein [Pirellulaceae bacterium]